MDDARRPEAETSTRCKRAHDGVTDAAIIFYSRLALKMCGVSKESARWWFFLCGEKRQKFFLNDFESETNEKRQEGESAKRIKHI